uniref:Ig-like domain-containing protein n=1 Tax=Anas platyrhynchos TaxID=8839 RepID=A0A8B9SM23_ANAPL
MWIWAPYPPLQINSSPLAVQDRRRRGGTAGCPPGDTGTTGGHGDHRGTQTLTVTPRGCCATTRHLLPSAACPMAVATSPLQWLVLLASLVPPAHGSWGVSYPPELRSITGSCVVFPCTLSFPDSISASKGIVAIWYKDYSNQKTVVYHSEGQDVDARFRDRAQLLGDPAAHNCTLLLRGVTPEDSGPYKFRFEIVDGDRWSAERDVELRVSGGYGGDPPWTPCSPIPEEVPEGTEVTFQCSTPYVCPLSDVALRWAGYDERVSSVSPRLQLDTSGVSHHLSLTSSFSWKDHARELFCEVLHGSQKASGELVLRVRHAPKGTRVSITPSAQNILVGDTVSLSCEVNSSYPPVSAYQWYKDGAAAGTERTLTLRGVRRADHGQYRCEAHNALGAGTAPPVMLYVFSAEISVSPAAEVREGTSAELSCDVPGREGQELNYTWYKNSAWLQDGPAHTLLFHRVATSDAGFYSCKVTNDRGSTTSQPVSLSVTYPPRTPSLTLLQEPQGGGLAVVHCSVDSRPPATLALYRDGNLVATSGSQVAPSQRLAITASRNALRLEIRGVRPQDGGQYRCTATNTLGNVSPTSPFPPAAARVQIQPSAEVREGEAVTLSCEVPGDVGPATFTWYRNGRWLREGVEPALSFPAIRSADAGAFQCLAQGSGHSHSSAAVTLRVLCEFPPRQPVMSSLLETQGGQLGIIQCSVQSDPEANLTLWRGGEALACTGGCPPAPSPRLQATASYNSLRLELRDVVLEDEGTYVCQAWNTQGNASASMAFSAETARVVVSPSPRVLEGSAANLTCQVSSGSPSLPNVTWYRNGQRIPRDPHPDASLVLQRVVRGDAGLYHCTAATGRSSRSSAAVLLDVLYPPRDPQLTAFLETQRGRLAIFEGSVASNPPAQLALYRGEELVASSGTGHGTNPRVSATATPNALRVEIRDVTLADEGTYSLAATNAHGTVSQHLDFRVQAARVLISPAAEVLEGDDVSLTCEVPGEPQEDATFSWYKDSKSLQDSPSRVLELPHVTSAAAGSYHCKAHGPAGTGASISPAISLRVLYPPRVPVLSSFLESPGGRRGVLQCRVDSSPPAQLELSKDGSLVASSALPAPATSPRLGVTAATNSLRVSIGDVLLEDEGEYVCAASNAYGNASTAANFTAGTARVWISPSPEVREGDAVTLTCAVESAAQEALSYTWYKNGVRLSSGTAPQIVLPSVGAADAASYHCAVLVPQPPPLSFPDPPRNMQLKAFAESSGGSAVILLCTVESNPPAELSLHRGGQLVASSASTTPTQRSPPPNALRLELPAAAAQDEGEYECRARSPLGSTSTSLPLHVQGEPVRVVVRPGSEVQEGTEVTLSCEDVGAQPGTVYAWFKNGRWLQEGPGAALLLRAARSSDAGAYSCQARTGARTRRRCAVLVLADAPRDPSFVSLVEPWGGRQAELLCTVDSHPPADITLLRGRAPLASTRGPSDPRASVQAEPNTLRVRMVALGPGDAGLYVCSANNSFGTASTSLLLAASGVRVTVEPSPEVPEGATATMNCSAVPWVGDEANYTWYKDSRWLREGPASVLVLGPVSSADAGFYHCWASGVRGSAASAPLSLTVLYAPRAVAVSTFLENLSGRVGIVLCVADSHPPAALALYRRGHLLASSLATASTPGLRAAASLNALRLEIAALGPEDAGDYSCVATNPLGNATASAYFDTRTLSHLLVFTVLAGLLLALLCVALLALLAVRLWPR